jgi:AcrR family transcriptional regulator
LCTTAPVEAESSHETAEEGRRRQILDAAQRLIETAGVMRLTTKEIAREARCTEGTLFKHFKRKEDLCIAVVLENAPRFKETIARKQPGRRTVEKNLEDIALAAVRFSEKLIPLGVTLLADTKLLARHSGICRGRAAVRPNTPRRRSAERRRPLVRTVLSLGLRSTSDGQEPVPYKGPAVRGRTRRDAHARVVADDRKHNDRKSSALKSQKHAGSAISIPSAWASFKIR